MDEKGYSAFLEKKLKSHNAIGWRQDEVSDFLFDYQKDIVKFCLERGQSAVFLDCGLGKTAIQLEWAHRVCEHTGGNVLIVAPLCVAEQTKRESLKFGIPNVKVCRHQIDVSTKISITNYEMLEHFDANKFVGVVLDESSILKGFMSKTRNMLCDMFSKIQYKLAATATPSPNDLMELLNQADWLGIIQREVALATWFVNDTANTGTWRIKKHAEADFWRWVCSWSIFADTPEDLGYPKESCSKFELPKLNVITHFLEEMNSGDDENLFKTHVINASDLYRHLRSTLPERAERAKEIVSKNDEQYIIWVNTNQESEIMTKMLPDAIEVRGSHSPEFKKQASLDFIDGKIRILISKPSIFGFGMNMQNCRNAVFLGLNFSYESYYQAIKRIHRFGQTRDVNVHIVLSESEFSIYKTVKDKQDMNDQAKESVMKTVRQFSLIKSKKGTMKMDYTKEITENNKFKLINGDSVEEIKNIPDNSVGFTIFSPPFANLYVYSDSYRDMGNCTDDDEFIEHFEYLAHDIFRITQKNRLCAIHCINIPTFKWKHGYTGIRDFRGMLIRLFQKVGFIFHSEITIWKDPVVEMQRTKSQGLLHVQVTERDASLSRQGIPDILIVFRKPSDNNDDITPIYHKDGFDFYIGENQPQTKKKLEYSIDVWQKYASPVWFDIRQTRVLPSIKGHKDEKHICPLQLDVIERAIHLWSNPGDTVFSPFAGIGSEGYGAVRLGRKFVGIELKPEYYEQAAKNIGAAIEEMQQATLFD